MKSKITLFLVIFTVMAVLVGCATPTEAPINEETEDLPSEEPSEPESEELTIAYSCGWAWVPYTIAGKLGAEIAAEEEGINLITASANNNMETQIADIENLVQQQVDGLFMYPIDSAGLSPIAVEVMDSDIPVGTVDIGLTEAKSDFHVTSDNYEIGVIAANFVGDYLGDDGGEIAIIGWSTIDVTVERETGFQDTLAANYPQVEVVAYYGDGGADRTAALDAAENILQAHPEVKLIWGSNQQAALGALAAVDAADVDIPIFGVDSDVESLTAIIENPRFLGTVSQDPYQMGYIAVKTMAAILRGETLEDDLVITDVFLVTPENAPEFLEKEQHYQDVYNELNN